MTEYVAEFPYTGNGDHTAASDAKSAKLKELGSKYTYDLFDDNRPMFSGPGCYKVRLKLVPQPPSAFTNDPPEEHLLPAFVVLGKTPEGEWRGTVEGSFSLDLSDKYVRMYWSGNAVSNFGTKHVIDGEKDAEKDRLVWMGRNPDHIFAVFDITDPDLPVTLDWRSWRYSRQRADNLSGVHDKYGARNVYFEPKRDE